MCILYHLFVTTLQVELGLKPDQVIRVNWVIFCLDQVGLTRFIKYLGLTWILH